MAKNRAAKTEETAKGMTEESPTTPGGEVPGGRSAGNDHVPEKHRSRVERALVHLEFITEELRELAGDKSPLAGSLRQTAAKMKVQMSSNTRMWPPLKTIRELLETVRDSLPPETE